MLSRKRLPWLSPVPRRELLLPPERFNLDARPISALELAQLASPIVAVLIVTSEQNQHVAAEARVVDTALELAKRLYQAAGEKTTMVADIIEAAAPTARDLHLDALLFPKGRSRERNIDGAARRGDATAKQKWPAESSEAGIA